MRFCIFMAGCISLIFYGIVSPSREFRLENYFTGEFAFHTTDNIQSSLITRTTNLGFAFIHHTHSYDAVYLRPRFSRIDGESITIREQLDAQDILTTLNARRISTSRIGEIYIVHAHTNRIPVFITHDGRRSNIQIAIRDSSTTIGWPAILGSF